MLDATRNRLPSILLPLLPLAASCGITDPVACTEEAVPSLAVSVEDSVTALSLEDPLVWVRDAAFVDTLGIIGSTAYGPYERPGTYEIHVEEEGYRDWLESGIDVEANRCHVETRELTARLQPAE